MLSLREEQSTLLCPLLATIFAEFDKNQIRYCLLRGYEDLFNGIIDGDVDLLVADEQYGRARRLLEQLGFVELVRWGQSPHHFYIGYDERNDFWIKLDIVTELAYGRPIPALRTNLAPGCLERRVLYGPSFVPAVEDEFLTLLLHCLLDKSTIEPAYQTRLVSLLEDIVDDQLVSRLIERNFPPAISWVRIKELVQQGNWAALYRMRTAFAGHLTRHDQLGTRSRQAITPILRFLDRRTRAFRSRGLTVALLAPDGAGKTTLAQSLGRAFFLPTRYMYMGTNLNSGSLTLPTTRLLARVKRKRRFTIRVLSTLNTLLEQSIRYRIGAYHRWRGRLVIFDRYSAGSLMGVQQGSNALKSIQRWVMQLLCPPPDMIVYLDAPAEVLYRRKQEHSIETLEGQRRRYMQILRNIAHPTIVDAEREPEQVRRNVVASIWKRYAAMKSK